MSIKVEVFSTPGCSSCDQARDSLKAVALAFGVDRVSWRDVNLLAELDYAVALGVLTPPSVAIDGQLVFSKLPAASRFRQELLRRLERERL